VSSNQLVASNAAINLPNKEKSLIQSVIINFDEEFIKYTPPTVSDYKFIGWFYDESFRSGLPFRISESKQFYNPKDNVDIFALYKKIG